MSLLQGFVSLFNGNKKQEENGQNVKVGESMSDSSMETLKEAENVSEKKEPIKERIVRYLNDNEWTFDLKEHSINTRVRGSSDTSYDFYIFFFENESRLMALTTMDNNIIEKRRASVAEFLTRVNYMRSIGNFEFDMDDGDVRYKTYINLYNNIDFLTDEVINDLIWFNVESLDLYNIAIMQLNYAIDNNMNVKEFLEKFLNELEK